jgi:hypothetical protein
VRRVVGATSHPRLRLPRHCELVRDMDEVNEPGPLGLNAERVDGRNAAISDATFALTETKSVTREDYGMRHHGGLARCAHEQSAEGLETPWGWLVLEHPPRKQFNHLASLWLHSRLP